MSGREESQFQALGGDPKKPADRVGDAYTFTNEQGHRMRFDTSSVPPVVSRIDERMGGVAAEVRAASSDNVYASERTIAGLDEAIRGLEAKREGIGKRIAAAAERLGSPIDPDNQDKTAEALDAAIAAQEARAKGNAESVGFDPSANPLDDPAALTSYEPHDPHELERLAKARAELGELRKTLQETATAIEEAREQRRQAGAAHDSALAAYKTSLEEANDRAGRNLDYFNDAGGRLLGPDGLSTVFGTVNENVGFRRALGLPGVFDLGGELEPEHRRAFARIMGSLHESDQIVRDMRTKMELMPQVGTVSAATA